MLGADLPPFRCKLPTGSTALKAAEVDGFEGRGVHTIPVFRITAVSVGLMLLLWRPCCGWQPSDAVTASLQQIRTDYGVTVHYHYQRERFFPAAWLRQPVNGRGGQIDLDELPRLVKLLDGFFRRYPDSVLKRNLKAIYLVSDLEFFGKSYGATQSRTAVYLCIGNAAKTWTDSFLTARLHSEFSSILMQNHDFPAAKWKALNPENFKYSGSGVEVLGTKSLYGQSELLLRRGFLVRYSQSSLENDFNMLSDWLFTRPEKLAELCNDHPQLAAKRTLAIQFYLSIDKRFKLK